MTALSPDLWFRLSETLGHTLLHSLWQGMIVALVLAACLTAIRNSNANARCLAATSAVFILPLWMAVTFSAAWIQTNCKAEISDPFAAPLATGPGESIAATLPTDSSRSAINPVTWRPVASAGWAIGAMFFLLRLAGGWRGLRQLRKSSVPVTDLEIRRLYAGVCDRLAIRERVALLSSDQLSTPLMSGFLWPAIILPAGMINGIPAAHLQSILAHELAHFRRWDYLVNLFQSLIEALLFYHPAMWWISRQVRIEREHACDDLAAALPGNDIRHYAGALAWLEENRFLSAPSEPAMAMVRDQRDTLSRIGRLKMILARSKNPTRQPGRPKAVASMIRSTGLVWVFVAGFGVAITSASTTNLPEPLLTKSTGRDSAGPAISVVSQCQSGRTRAETSTRLLNERVIWKRRFCDGIEIPLFRSVVILEREGKLYNLHKEKPRLFEDFPNRYLLDNKLNFLDGGLPQRDADGDGFTNLEEFQADTDPNEARIHPDYTDKLRFISRHAQVYRITFAARPDDTRFQLNRSPSARWDRKTMILRMGEITGDSQLRLDKLTDEGLEVTFLASGADYRLPKRKQIEIPTWFAKLQLDLSGEEPFFVELGEDFRLSRQPDRVLRLMAVEENGVEVLDPETGDSRTIGSLAKSSD